MVNIDFKLKGKAGIYQIFNLENGKRYIGSSKDVYNRLHEHLHNLNNNKAHNKHLQLSWNKHGEINFHFSILEYCDENIRFEREQYYLDVLKPEYNLTLQVVANEGHSPTEETRKQISNTLKNKYSSGEIETYKQQHLWQTTYVYNILNFSLCGEFTHLAEALKCLRGVNSKGSNHFDTVFKNKYILSYTKFESLKELKDFINQKYKTVRHTSKGKFLISETPDGDFVYHRTTTECAQFNGISSSMILKHKNASKDNPYCPSKSLNKIYYSDIYYPVKNIAVPIEELLELSSGNIGEKLELESRDYMYENPEINLEGNMSKSLYSVENEPLKDFNAFMKKKDKGFDNLTPVSFDIPVKVLKESLENIISPRVSDTPTEISG